jgi:hypothetical protein
LIHLTKISKENKCGLSTEINIGMEINPQLFMQMVLVSGTKMGNFIEMEANPQLSEPMGLKNGG